jgi:hypothetical protein
MPLTKAVSYCLIEDSFEAGKLAMEEVKEKLHGEIPDFLFLFTTIGHDTKEVIKGIYSAGSSIPLCGCTGSGVITSSGCDEASRSVGLMGIKSKTVKFTPFIFTGLSKDVEKPGRQIGNKIKSLDLPKEDKKLLILLPDGLFLSSGPFLPAIKDELGYHIDCVGGTAGNDYHITSLTYQFCNNEVYHDSVAGVIVSGDFNYDIEVSHGSKPIGLPKTITKASENIVYEIDNEPVLEFLKKYWGERRFSNFGQNLNLFGFGQLFQGKGYSQDIIIRAILGFEENGIRLKTPLPVGTQIYMTRRDRDMVKEGTQYMTEKLLSSLKKPDECAYFYFNCSGRASHLYGETEPDVNNLLEILGDKDMIGFFTFGEYAPVGGENYFHNYTGVILGIE